DAKVYHVGGGTLNAESPFKTFLNFRNNLWMIQKNSLPASALIKVIIRFFMDFLSLLKFLFEGKTKNAAAVSKAHVAFLRNWKKNASKRPAHFKKYNASGVYPRSIVWQYFVRNKKKFTDLPA
ncbi:MAG: hypothetical protein RLZ47_1758, partial [Bacteroidota bacterium]